MADCELYGPANMLIDIISIWKIWLGSHGCCFDYMAFPEPLILHRANLAGNFLNLGEKKVWNVFCFEHQYCMYIVHVEEIRRLVARKRSSCYKLEGT